MPTVPVKLQVPPVAFDQVAGGLEQWEVARNFSAMLQLVNAGNIGVDRGPWEDANTGDASSAASLAHPGGHPFTLRLLCLAPASQRLAGFKAPSLQHSQVRFGCMPVMPGTTGGTCDVSWWDLAVIFASCQVDHPNA